MSSLSAADDGIAIDSQEDGTPALVLRGEVAIYRAGQLREAVATLIRREADVVVSCEAVERLDASAIQILLMMQRELRGRGRNVRLAGVSGPVRETLRLAGIDKLLLECTAKTGG